MGFYSNSLTCQAMEVDFVSPRNVMSLGKTFGFGFIKRVMTNILWLKNLIRLYRVTYDSERRTAFIVHRVEFGLRNMVFDMHPCGLHVYYPKKLMDNMVLSKLLLTI